MKRSLSLAALLSLATIAGLADTSNSGSLQSAAASQSPSKIVIGAEDDWYPYSAKRNGLPVGMAAEIVIAASAAANLNIQLVSLPYARCMSETSKGEIAGCFDTLRTPLNESQYLWHKTPLFLGRINIYATSNHIDTPVTVRDLKGKSVATTNGYDYGEAFDSDKSIKRDSGLMDINGLRKLAQGKVDYGVFYDQTTDYLLHENPELEGKIKSVGVLIEGELYLSFAKHYPNIKQVIKQFNTGMDIIRRNGDYAKIVKKWQRK